MKQDLASSYAKWVRHDKKKRSLFLKIEQAQHVSFLRIHRLTIILKKERTYLYQFSSLLKEQHFSYDWNKKIINNFQKHLAILNAQEDILLKKQKIIQRLSENDKKRFRLFISYEERLDSELQSFLLPFILKEPKLRSSRKLLTNLQKSLQTLRRSLGNSRLVQKNSLQVLYLIKKLQNTEMYAYLSKDIRLIQRKVEYIHKHPKESRLAYILTTIYIFAPGTFEATGVFLFFRYLGKYAVKRTKLLKQKVKKVIQKD